MNNEKLPVAFKKKWVDALVSGKYEQGAGRLYSPQKNSFCCLGVACVANGMNCEDLDSCVINHLGQLAERTPTILHSFRPTSEGGDSISDQLIILNDDGVPFEVIAGVINEWL